MQVLKQTLSSLYFWPSGQILLIHPRLKRFQLLSGQDHNSASAHDAPGGSILSPGGYRAELHRANGLQQECSLALFVLPKKEGQMEGVEGGYVIENTEEMEPLTAEGWLILDDVQSGGWA